MLDQRIYRSRDTGLTQMRRSEAQVRNMRTVEFELARRRIHNWQKPVRHLVGHAIWHCPHDLGVPRVPGAQCRRWRRAWPVRRA